MIRPIRTRPQVDHAAMAAQLRAQPGVWQRFGQYGSSASADGAARAIRQGTRSRCYWPAGFFEAEAVVTPDGYAVRARYIGPPLT